MPDDNSSAATSVSSTPTLPTVADTGASTTNSTDTVDVPDKPDALNTTSVPEPPMSESTNAPVSDTVVVPDVPADPAVVATPEMSGGAEVGDMEIPAEVARKISEAHNVLVALSGNPSVDEMAAAIGLSLYLDRLGKRATAIYSGQTPNALEFLKPEETFENSVDTLQDFVIALNKDKADHLRYKLDGDYVKIYITPYRSRISEEDLEFTYGDYNVDLVLALDVANGVDLDAALREHGRIMHDAVIINITTGNPGRLGEIEWSDKSASSVSEMIAKLLYSANNKIKIEKEEATAFLTGIVAATNRFSNAGTTPETMQIASRLMESGANQQLVSKNITPDVENELFKMPGIRESTSPKVDNDPTKLDIQHSEKDDASDDVSEPKTVSGTITEKESTLLDDLKAAEASLMVAGAETTPEMKEAPLKIDSAVEEGLPEVENKVKEEVSSDANIMDSNAVNDVVGNDATGNGITGNDVTGDSTTGNGVIENGEIGDNTTGNGVIENGVGVGNAAVDDSAKDAVIDKNIMIDGPEKVIEPAASMNDMRLPSENEAEKYGQMLENALADAGDSDMKDDNPAMVSAPPVANNPEINGVPEINYMPMPGEEVLPPPPAPPIDMSAPVPTETMAAPVTPIEPAAPVIEEKLDPLGTQPAMQDQVYNSQANDPGAFKIPGM